MKKLFALLMGICLSHALSAQEPARRPQLDVRTEPASVLCRDRVYECMYPCTVEEGAVCAPTKNSDANCPSVRVKSARQITKQLMVLDFVGYHDMSCRVLKQSRSNLHCGNTQFGWDCWTGRMHDDD